MTRSRCQLLAVGVAVGAVLEYLLDPERGRRRRRAVQARTAALGRRAGRRGRRLSRTAALRAVGHARGAVHRLRPAPARQLDDVELAHKVETALGREPDVPKGCLSINAENGTVFLRGELDSPELIEKVVVAVWRVGGVEDVANLLHLPGAPAPSPR